MQLFWLPTFREAPDATHAQSSASAPQQITIIHCCESLDIKNNITAVVKGVQHQQYLEARQKCWKTCASQKLAL